MISFFSLISPLVYYCNAHSWDTIWHIYEFFPLLKCLDIYFEKTIMPRSNSSVKYILIKSFEWSSEPRIVSWFEWFQSYLGVILNYAISFCKANWVFDTSLHMGDNINFIPMDTFLYSGYVSFILLQPFFIFKKYPSAITMPNTMRPII